MSISLTTESLLTFDEAAAFLPQGRRPSYQTWWRWWRHGCFNGIKLETLLVGGRRYTTLAAVKKFAAELTDHRERQVQPPKATVTDPRELVTTAVPCVGGDS